MSGILAVKKCNMLAYMSKSAQMHLLLQKATERQADFKNGCDYEKNQIQKKLKKNQLK